MICKVYNGNELVETFDLEPECGEDFCASCGDCLACYSSDCADGEYCNGPFWSLCIGDDDERIAELRALAGAVVESPQP